MIVVASNTLIVSVVDFILNSMIGIILQETKKGIQNTIKKNINILKVTKADTLHMIINIIQATDNNLKILLCKWNKGFKWNKYCMDANKNGVLPASLY